MLQVLKRFRVIKELKSFSTACNLNSFLPQAFHCNEVWAQSICQTKFADKKINLDELYYEIDQRFQQTRQVSPVDIAVFSNSVKDNVFIDELLDLIHKLRLSAETTNSLKSTSYTVIKALINNERAADIINIIDDRINYGIFADHYSLALLLDYFYLKKDFSAGARVASQIMLQEFDESPISFNLAILHCYNCLVQNSFWETPDKPVEPEEKVRVKYIRNPYDDDHFDLREPKKIIGKTLIHLTKNKQDPLNVSFNILGLCLYEKNELAQTKIVECNQKLYQNVLSLIPEDNDVRKSFTNLEFNTEEIDSILKKNVENAVNLNSEKFIAEQCKKIEEFDQELIDAIKTHEENLQQQKRIKEIETIQKDLEEKERKLWFFENEENMELKIEQRQQNQEKTKKH